MPGEGLPLIDRIDAFQREHREIVIGAPWATESGLWEVTEPPAVQSTWRRGVEMITALEERYSELAGLRAAYPMIEISAPGDTLNSRWMVSFPDGNGTASFDTLPLLLRCLGRYVSR